METELLKTVGQVAGVGGVALGSLFLVYREMLRKALLPKLARGQAYRLLRLITLTAWSVAIVGLLTWGWVEARSASNNPLQTTDVGSASAETGIANTGEQTFHDSVNIGSTPASGNPKQATGAGTASVGTGIANTGEQIFQGTVNIGGAPTQEKP